jgi:hypothetical protein
MRRTRSSPKDEGVGTADELVRDVGLSIADALPRDLALPESPRVEVVRDVVEHEKWREGEVFGFGPRADDLDAVRLSQHQ